MSDKPEGPERDRELNPALKQRQDRTHDTTGESRSPAETASVQREEGRAWPAVWAAVVILGVLILIYLLL